MASRLESSTVDFFKVDEFTLSLSVHLTEGDRDWEQYKGESTAPHGAVSSSTLFSLPRERQFQLGDVGEEVASSPVRKADAGFHHIKSVQPSEHEG